MWEHVMFIGGSSCAGKTTAARMLANKYDLLYYSVDDDLGSLAAYGIQKGYPICCRHSRMSMEAFFSRPPAQQCRELLAFYKELHHRIMQTVAGLPDGRPVLAEGVAFLPSLMKEDGIPPEQYLCVAADPDFQVRHYRERSWTALFLEGCADREKAFSSWMEREALFTGTAAGQAKLWGCGLISVKTDADAAALPEKTEKYFRLKTTGFRQKGAEGTV